MNLLYLHYLYYLYYLLITREEHEIRTVDTSCVDIYLVYTKVS